jgi:uncharacterized protein YueI
MFSYANIFVDTVQTAKTNTLKSMITDEKVRAPLQSFIDAQTSFTKEMIRIADGVYNQFAEQVEKFTGKKV